VHEEFDTMHHDQVGAEPDDGCLHMLCGLVRKRAPGAAPPPPAPHHRPPPRAAPPPPRPPPPAAAPPPPAAPQGVSGARCYCYKAKWR
jgi:hypothetical protein